MTQKLYFYKEELYGRPDVLAHVRDLKRNDPKNI
jgi:hypothetical protein